MKLIKDIRLFRSAVDNIDYNPGPSTFNEGHANIVLARLVMKLRENNFSLGDFDHLSINYTPCIPDHEYRPARCSVDRYHPWHRCYDIGIQNKEYDQLEYKNDEWFVSSVVNVLIAYFCPTDDMKLMVKNSADEVLKLGVDLTYLYKMKQGKGVKAEVYLRLLDNHDFAPYLIVKDACDSVLLKKDLPQMRPYDMPLHFGTIQLSRSKITIKPRTSVFAQGIKPIVFEY